MDYQTLSNQAQQQGQANYNDYIQKANKYSSDYYNYKGQADTAQGQMSDFSKYMQNEGNASNLYKNALFNQLGMTGYDQNQMQNAMRSLTQSQGNLSAYNDFANTAASKWGMNAGGLAAANAGALSNINNNIGAASQGLSNQQQAYQLAQTGANQEAGLGIQQQQTQLAAYKSIYDQAFAQQQQASSNMLAYQKMAQEQGGLTAQQVQMYQQSATLAAQAEQAMASAAAAMANARQLNAQTDIALDKNQYAKDNLIGDYSKKTPEEIINDNNNKLNADKAKSEAEAYNNSIQGTIANGIKAIPGTVTSGLDSWVRTIRNNPGTWWLGQGTFW